MHTHHAQSVFYKQEIVTFQLYYDITGDTTLSDLTRAGIHMSAAFNAGKCLVPLAISNKTHDMCGVAPAGAHYRSMVWTFHVSRFAMGAVTARALHLVEHLMRWR